jgi:hypothetical protein
MQGVAGRPRPSLPSCRKKFRTIARGHSQPAGPRLLVGAWIGGSPIPLEEGYMPAGFGGTEQ